MGFVTEDLLKNISKLTKKNLAESRYTEHVATQDRNSKPIALRRGVTESDNEMSSLQNCSPVTEDVFKVLDRERLGININGHTTISEILGAEYDTSTDLGTIPEREWRLLAALARKRKEEDEREKLAEQFHRMWQQEKEGREMMEAKTSSEYKRYIKKKREDERVWHEHRRLLKNLENHMQKDQLLNTIRTKERKAEELLAWKEDKKASEMVNRVLEDEARAFLAAERRSRQESAAEWRRLLEVEETKRRADYADKRRNEILQESSRRLAIASALNNWERSLVREELASCEAARRAQCAARGARAAARGERVARARARGQRRARAVARRCELWRDAVRRGNY